MSSITTSALETPARRSLERTCDDLAIVVLTAVTLNASLTFHDYGLGWDDYTHAEYADLLLRMYGASIKDTGSLSLANLSMYGVAFEVLLPLQKNYIPLGHYANIPLSGTQDRVVGL